MTTGRLQGSFNNGGATNLTLDDVIIRSSLKNSDSQKQTQAILQEFNKNIQLQESCFVHSYVRGRWINPDEFMLGHRNKKPELAAFNHNKNTALKLNFNPALTYEQLGIYKVNALFYGGYGSYVLNVPVNQYAKAHSGNNPLIFGPGPHVIHDANFRFSLEDGLVDQTESYIRHDTLHILRVPAGKVAKIWIGAEPFILEYRAEPYIFNDPLFRIESTRGNQLFENATAELIVHGSIKRIMPHTGKVAVTYNNGNLEVIHPCIDSKPTIITSPTHEVHGFLCIAIQTLNFPSERTKAARLKDNSNAPIEERIYEVFTTKDSLKVGVTLVVAYSIKDPQKALTLLSQDDIINHIENLATADMRKAIQQCSSQEFLTFYQTKPRDDKSNLEQQIYPSAPPLEHFQDIVKRDLYRDLKEYGIELVRLNIESAKVLNETIAKQMAEQSIGTAKISAQLAMLEGQSQITSTQAQQNANAKRIQQEQENWAKTSQAQAELEAARLRAQATIVEAEANLQAQSMRGEALKNPQLFQLEMKRLEMDALSKAQFVPPQFNKLFNPSMFSSPMTLFASLNTQSDAQCEAVNETGNVVQLKKS